MFSIPLKKKQLFVPLLDPVYRIVELLSSVQPCQWKLVEGSGLTFSQVLTKFLLQQNPLPPIPEALLSDLSHRNSQSTDLCARPSVAEMIRYYSIRY